MMNKQESEGNLNSTDFPEKRRHEKILDTRDRLNWFQSKFGYFMNEWGIKHKKTLKLSDGTRVIYENDKYEVEFIVRER